jgi:hypothetical protein
MNCDRYADRSNEVRPVIRFIHMLELLAAAYPRQHEVRAGAFIVTEPDEPHGLKADEKTILLAVIAPRP